MIEMKWKIVLLWKCLSIDKVPYTNIGVLWNWSNNFKRGKFGNFKIAWGCFKIDSRNLSWNAKCGRLFSSFKGQNGGVEGGISQKGKSVK